MTPLGWAAIAGGAVASILLLAGKAKAQPQLPPVPTNQIPVQTYGETTVVQLPVPAGWRRAQDTEVSALPELGVAANMLRNTPGFTSMQYGTLTPFIASDGGTYATWIEQHYHPPGGLLQPWGLHHGVTLLASSS